MTEKQRKTVRLVYFVLVTAALLVAAVCLMSACVSIYRTGDHPFSREAVAAAFAPIAVPVFVCLGLVAVGFILHPLLPAAADAAPDRDEVTLGRLLARDLGEVCNPELASAIRREYRARQLHRWLSVGLLTAGAAVFLWYALNVDHFHRTEINASMIAAMWVLLPCMGIPFAFGVFAAYHRRRSIRREIALLRQIPGAPAPAAAAPNKDKWLAVARYAVLVLAVGMVLYGWLAEGWMDVLTKAINICTECIGLG